ncbi:MAG: hypothetical protein ACLFV4_03255 [Candidatus Hydrogenedentota bacterium]
MMARYVLGLVCVLALMGCVTVPGVGSELRPDFDAVPEQTLRQAAREIEEAVLAADEDYVPQARDDLMLDTELIRQTVRTRVLRGERVNELRDTPWAYEQRSGVLALRRGRDYRNETTPEQRRQHAALVYRENDSRWTLYEAIRESNDLGARGYDAIRLAFFEARVEAMPTGQLYEGPDGELQRKGE